ALDVGAAVGASDLLEVDMGGTSFDICVIRNRRIPTTKDAWVGDERVATKMVDISAIGAGGGSIAWIDSLGLLRVGPQSAGADPGPAAYGRSELPTVTDADVVLGYVPADYFLGGELRLDRERALAAVRTVAEPLGLDPDAGAEAIFETVNGTMADAVTEACTRKGLDVRGFAMVAGGGAGGVHGAEIARRLGIPRIVCPATGPALSAMGMLTMEVGRELTRAGVWDRAAAAAAEINATFAELIAEQAEAFARSGIDPGTVRYRRALAMRYEGQFHEIDVELPEGELDDAGRATIDTRFHRRYEELYGYSLPWRTVEVLECHLRGSVPQGGPRTVEARHGEPPPLAVARAGGRRCRIAGTHRDVPVYHRERLASGHAFAGPALVDSATSTVLVPDGFEASVDGAGNLLLTQGDAARPAAAIAAAEPAAGARKGGA
ncbi:MAG TPA: hydantoinase/oxoprolinase family protein, partial [Solirubrobacterales bacterium]|nr:hydantoinase/oxoprolinase family protein [Solirubrobacterales bacterium]